MMHPRKLLALLLCAVMLLSVLPMTAAAETSGLQNFKKVNTYNAGTFTDVSTTDWFSDNVKAAYELGLMIGQGESFGVENNLTVAEAVTLAARLHSIYSGDNESFVPGTPWYQIYVNYVKSKNLVSLDGLDMTTPSTRAQFAKILAAALPNAALKGVNNVADNAIPDVKLDDDGAEAIYKLYRAGILVGNDAQGTFAPSSNIKRSEVAAIVTRMADSSLRKAITLGEFYTVTFDLNYPTVIENQVVSVEAGKTVSAPLNPKRSSFLFTGWYTAASGGIKFDFVSKINSDITLYAHWSFDSYDESYDTPTPTPTSTPIPTSYTVTFESNGGSEVPSQTVISGECAEKPVSPYRVGFSFIDWYTDKKFENVYDFTSKITSSITLYARWEEADVLIDKDNTEVGPDDIYVLSSSDTEVIAESSTRVVFYVNSTLTLFLGFDLYCDGAYTGVTLYDDGNFSDHGDDIPNDGCYSGFYVIDFDEEKDYSFTASATVGTTGIETNAVEIFVYYELTDSNINEMVSIDECLQSIITEITESNPNVPEEELVGLLHDALLAKLNELEAEGKIYGIIDDENNYIISFVTSGGICDGIWYYGVDWDDSSASVEEGVCTNGISSGIDVAENAAISIDINDYVTYKERVLLLCYENSTNGWNGATFEDTTANLGSIFNKADFSVDERYNVTVDDFLNMEGYDYIHVACHGTGEPYKVWTGPFSYEETPVICTPQSSSNAGNRYSSDLKKKRIISVNGNYCIRPSFFDFYYGVKNPLKATVVHLGCCGGGYTDELADAIVNSGAKTVFAYSDTVYTAYDYYLSAWIVNEMLSGRSTGEAWTSAKQEYGESDLIWGAKQRDTGNQNFNILKNENARLKLYNNTETKIHNSLINGNFDSYALFGQLFSNIPMWKSYGDARGIYKLSGITPMSAPKMAIISSGFGSKNNETTSCLYQTFLVPHDATMIEFNYDVVSEEPMEYVGSEYNDIFQVDILKTDGSILETIAYESVNSSTWYAVNGIDFPGGDETTYHTRWKSITSYAIQNYRDQLVVLRFTVQDAGDSIYDTAALIDTVSIG